MSFLSVRVELSPGIKLLFTGARDKPPRSSVPCRATLCNLPTIFWTALSERRRALELGGGPKPETDTFGHEPALVARGCSPAKLLDFPKLVGTPRRNDARRCHQCDWHSQGGRPAIASCPISEPLRGVSRLTPKITPSSYYRVLHLARVVLRAISPPT